MFASGFCIFFKWCCWSSAVVSSQAAKQMQKYAERRMQEDKEMRDLVQQVAEGHKNSKTVQAKLRKMKQNIGGFLHLTLSFVSLPSF